MERPDPVVDGCPEGLICWEANSAAQLIEALEDGAGYAVKAWSLCRPVAPTKPPETP
jgi:hypothetical protein